MLKLIRGIVLQFTGFATGKGHTKRRLSGLKHDDKINKKL